MTLATHAGFKIKIISDGSLYRAKVERKDGQQFLADGTVVQAWETSQSMDGATAVGQAIYAIDSGRIKLSG
jgi:hypothetical protein